MLTISGCKLSQKNWFAVGWVQLGKILAVLAGVFIFGFGTARATTYQVTSNSDGTGSGTLRWAINSANNHSGADTITFSNHFTFTPGSQLPYLTDNSTFIKASPNWIGSWPDGSPGETLNGTNAGSSAHGFRIQNADYCKISGFFIHNFMGGRGIMLDGNASYNTIGGAGTGERNVIVNNATEGIMVYGEDCGYNKIAGNYVGVRADGVTAGSNDEGVELFGHHDTLGGSTPAERNIISGNTPRRGVEIERYCTYAVVIGNYIGTDKTGTIAVPNGDGIIIMADDYGTPYHNRIGGYSAGERNIISGNNDWGINQPNINPDYNTWSTSSYNVIVGNWIGLDVNGNALPNSDGGVHISAGVSDTIGGTSPGARNIIAGNGNYGILIEENDDVGHHIIQGNFIGLNAAGVAKPNGIGICISESDTNLIGGTSSSARNVISGNTGDGILLEDGARFNSIKNNYIGTDTLGTGSRPNGGAGIFFREGARRDTVGAPGAGNIIAFNTSCGISLVNTPFYSSCRYHRFSANSFFSNGQGNLLANSGLAIDLADNGVSLNDGAMGAGLPNNGVDYPKFDTVKCWKDTLYVAGFVGTSRSAAASSGTFANTRVEVYKAKNDPTGYGEGKTYVGYLTTNATNSLFAGNIIIPSGIVFYGGDSISGISIVSEGSTSEFGQNDPVLYPTAVVIRSFSAEAGPNGVTVLWTTATEMELAGFNLYRIADGSSAWEKLNTAAIRPHGDPLTGGAYDFSDPTGSTNLWYRLETVSLSGASWYTDPIKASSTGVDDRTDRLVTGMSVFPTLARTSVDVRFTVAASNVVRIAAYNTAGQAVGVLVEGSVARGSYRTPWNIRGLPAGVYFLVLECGTTKHIERIVVIK